MAHFRPRRAGVFLLPSSPKLNPPENRNQSKILSFFSSFSHNPLFLLGGILLDGESCHLCVILEEIANLIIVSRCLLKSDCKSPASLKAVPGSGR